MIPLMSPASFRIGLIVPSSNTTMEPDFHRVLGAKSGVNISTTRIFLEQVTRDAEVQMLAQELPAALRLIKTTAPDVVVFGCTSAGSLQGLDHDANIGRVIERETAARAVTVVASVMAELRAAGAKNVAVFTPYREELTKTVADCVTEAGYSVVHAVGMGLLENRDIGRVTPGQIIEFVESQMISIRGADCLFLSCTNWQAIQALDPLRTKFGMPAVSSNQATIAAVERYHRQSEK